MSLAEQIPSELPRFDSIEAFCAWAELQPERWELWDGVPRMMTGGSLNHSRLSRNAVTALASRLGPGPCEPFGSDAAVRLDPIRMAYPDVSVSCEPEDGLSLLHPVVVIEVLSPSTQSHGLGDKAAAYRRLPSLRHLAFVRQDRIAIQHFWRASEAEEFTLTEIDRVDVPLRLDAIDVEIPMVELYAQVTFGP